MVAISSLSVAALELRRSLYMNIDGLEVDQITIGYPKSTFAEMKNNKNYLNLFFYNAQYDGYPADGLSDDPFYLRLHCLITAVGVKTNDASSGENDLRLVGEAMRVLHQHPMLMVTDKDNNDIAQLQVVPHPLNLDNLNHVWSTQGDTPYRLSVAYEMALAPIPITEAISRSPLVGAIGSEVQGNMDKKPLPDSGFGIETTAPLVPKVTVAVEQPDWTPHLCFYDIASGRFNYTLLIPVSAALTAGLQLNIFIAGKPAESVDLIWETWNPSNGAWERTSAPQTNVINTASIDPENIDPGLAVAITLPLQEQGQATLYAQREWQRLDGSTYTLRSNPLLVTAYGAAP